MIIFEKVIKIYHYGLYDLNFGRYSAETGITPGTSPVKRRFYFKFWNLGPQNHVFYRGSHIRLYTLV